MFFDLLGISNGKYKNFFESEKLWLKRDQLLCDFGILDIFIKILDFGNFIKNDGVFFKKEIIYLVILKFWNFEEIVMKLTFIGPSQHNHNIQCFVTKIFIYLGISTTILPVFLSQSTNQSILLCF